MTGPPPLQIHCTVSGAELIKQITADAICQRFVAAFGRARGIPVRARSDAPASGLDVHLAILPPGIAMATIIPVEGGVRAPMLRFNRAISDRAITLADIDHLADDVVAGLDAPAPR